MLKTMWVYGIGIMVEIFLALGFILFLPIGICILAAYLSRSQMGPSEVRLRTDSGFKAFPLYPFRFLLMTPFLKDPVQFFLGLITLHVISMPSNRLVGKVLILIEPECTRMHTASLLEVQGSVPYIFRLSNSGFCFLMYYEAMMILIYIDWIVLFDWRIDIRREAILQVYRDRCRRMQNRSIAFYLCRDC